MPFGFDGVLMRSFWFRAAQSALEEVCDYYLNEVAAENGLHERWDPFGIVIVTVATYDKIFSKQYPAMGYMQQSELVFSVPVIKTNIHGWPVELGVFTPYCYVDNDWSMVGGREMLGYPKLLGWFDLPRLGPAPGPPGVSGITIRANVMEHFHEDEKLERKPVLWTDNTPAPAPLPYPANVDDPNDPNVVASLRKLWPFGPPELYEGDAAPIVEAGLPELVAKYAGSSQLNVGIKQLRDPGMPELACYEGLTTTILEVTRFRGAGRLPDKPIHFPEYASLNIFRRLGLGYDPGAAIEPIWSQWYYGDFVNGESRNLVQRIHPPWNVPHGDLAEDLSAIYRDAIDDSFEQWQESAEKIMRLRYGPMDYFMDVMDGYLRAMQVSRYVSERLSGSFPMPVPRPPGLPSQAGEAGSARRSPPADRSPR